MEAAPQPLVGHEDAVQEVAFSPTAGFCLPLARGSYNAAVEPAVHLLVTEGCKIVNRNLSMTEGNELLVESYL